MESVADWPLWMQIVGGVFLVFFVVMLVWRITSKGPVVGPGGGGGGGGGGSGDDDEPDKPEVPI